MKVWTVSAVSVGLAASVASAEIIQFNQKLLALSGHPVRTGDAAIRFNTFQSEPLPPTLQTREGRYGGSERIECSISEGYKNSGTATVVLAISKCLPQSEIDVVEAWISKVKAENHLYEDNGELKEISFSTTFVPGECQELTESEKTGRVRSEDKPSEPSEPSDSILLSEGASYRSFKDVQPGESARLQAFAQYGRVLEGPDDLQDNGPPVAMMSFVNNEHSYDYVMGLEATYKISNTFNFEICREGVSCNGHFENCIALQETVDVFMYNPFQITRSFQCSRLDGGIPVTYADEHGKRQCFCACPAGSEMKEDEAKQGSYKCVTTDPDVCPCTWSTHPFGFKYENTEKLTQCSFTNIATQWGVPVPFPLDNYVADLRTNNNDAIPDELPFGPRVDVSVTPKYSDEFDHEKLVGLHDHVMAGQPMPDLPPDLEEMFNVFGQGEIPPVYEPPTPYGEKKSAHYTWKDYQVNSLDKIDDIKLTAYGKYELSVDAFDYTATSAQCVGCVAVVDKFRPKATTACPVSFCDDTTSLCATGETAVAELTADNVKKADGLVDDFYQFKQKAVNDACGDNRCDDDAFSYRDFFESASSSHNKPFASGRTCFTTLEDDFKTSAVATTNPLKLENGKSCQSPSPVDSTQCMRCCEYSTALREIWTDYTCGYDYDQRYCDGDADQKCSFKQCLVLKGDMLVQASASIKKDVCDHSKEVLKGLSDQGFQTYTQIHRALPCSDFGEAGGTCSYTTSVDQLLDIDTTNKFGGDTNTYAFWRYKIDGDTEGWRLWEDQTPFEFLHTQTKITLEAWTACGRARKFYFYVHLHPHSDIKVCEVFKQMWYQTSKSRVEVPTELCAYPGSDFAELTFDYQANIGLKHSRNNLHLSIADVTCSLGFHDRTPIEILHVNSGSFEILQRYAIELQNQATTTEDTQFTVTCKFTYEGPGGVPPVEKTCPLELTITDCNGPTIDIPLGDCTWDDCAGQAAPGPYEACGGHVVRATDAATYMDTEDTECCKACQPLVCTPVLNLPDVAQDIKRCVPKDLDDEYEKAMYSNFQFDGGYYDRAAVFMATAVAQHPMAVVATALMGVSALAAVVALVVVRRRRADAAVVVEDAYYPLLH